MRYFPLLLLVFAECTTLTAFHIPPEPDMVVAAAIVHGRPGETPMVCSEFWLPRKLDSEPNRALAMFGSLPVSMYLKTKHPDMKTEAQFVRSCPRRTAVMACDGLRNADSPIVANFFFYGRAGEAEIRETICEGGKFVEKTHPELIPDPFPDHRIAWTGTSPFGDWIYGKWFVSRFEGGHILWKSVREMKKQSSTVVIDGRKVAMDGEYTDFTSGAFLSGKFRIEGDRLRLYQDDRIKVGDEYVFRAIDPAHKFLETEHFEYLDRVRVEWRLYDPEK